MKATWKQATVTAALALGLLAGALAAPSGTASADDPLPAFPGAEGYGMYTTGGRGGDVYEVTNLNDSGPGSLRDAVSGSNRTIVFRVGGTIHLSSLLPVTGSNLTIAGQTAPGDGIAVVGYPIHFRSDNVIVRYMRFRLGDVNNYEADAGFAGGRKNLIIDHCTFTWGNDEVLSSYPNEDVTVQWSIVGEALDNSVNHEGRHGLGGIWGSGASYHHNLIVHNFDRNPRFMTYSNPPFPPDRVIDFRNNVIYNWNLHSITYGQNLNFNVVNNYLKWGPDTRFDKRDVILAAIRDSTYHLSGNVVDGSPAVTADNSLGILYPSAGAINLTASETEIPRTPGYPETTVTTHTAEDAYELVLAGAGAILPKRDSADARTIAEVRGRTGRILDSQREVGGYPVLASGTAPTDTDHDGMPDSWESANGLDPNDPSDRNGDADNDGYTNLEEYLNGIVGNGSNNPAVSITSPAMHAHLATGGSVTIDVYAWDSDGTVEKVEFYANDTLLGEDLSSPFSYVWSILPEGTHYLTARAVDNLGTATTSSSYPVYIDNTGSISPWQSLDIGTVGIAGHADITGGTLTVKSAGFIRNTGDVFHYVYRPLEGNGEMIVRVDDITRTNEEAKAGIMVRDSLTSSSRMAMVGLDNNMQQYRPTFYERAADGIQWQTEQAGFTVQLPYWLKLIRFGEQVSAYVSQDGAIWTLVGETEFGDGDAYIGIVSDPAQEPHDRLKYNTSRFTGVAFNVIPDVPAAPSGLTISRSVYDVALNWNPVAFADGYVIKRSYTQGGPYREIGASSATSYIDTTAQPGINYFYVVHASNAYGESVFASNEANGAILDSDPRTHLVYEDFEYATLGTQSPPLFQPKETTATNYLAVSAVPSGSTGNASGQALELYDASSVTTEGSFAFPDQSGVFTVEVDFMEPTTLNPTRIFRLLTSTRYYVELMLYKGNGCGVDPCFSYRASDGLYYALPNNSGFTANVWHAIRASVDVPNEEVTYWINGLPAGTVPFYKAAGWPSPASLGKYVAFSDTSRQYSYYLDNVKLIVDGPDVPVLQAEGASASVELEWSAVAGAESYNVYRLNSVTGRYVPIALGVTGTEYADTGLTAGISYTYAVAAVHSATGEGDYSAAAGATPTAP